MDSDTNSISSSRSSVTCVSDSTPPTSLKKLTPKPTSKPKSISNVDWVPLKGIPIERRLQMMAVLAWLGLIVFCLGTFLLLAFYRFLWPLMIAYLTFIFYIDPAPESGGRRFESVRRWTLWRYFAAYFPVQLLKLHDLDPTRNYVFGYHPHGIISMGAFANFATEATGFSNIFPGIVPSLLTLRSNFNLPFYRDVLMALGVAAVSRPSCEAILRSGPGRSIVIVVGGAAESLSARPGVADLVLRRRLGFIRLAIKSQADLVPVFSFGENDIFDQVDNFEGSALLKLQNKMKAVLGFTLPLFHARGVFNYNVGIVPFRHPITSVVGKPIPVPKLEKGQTEPTKEQILATQKLYMDELINIYETYKDVFAKDRTQELRFID